MTERQGPENRKLWPFASGEYIGTDVPKPLVLVADDERAITILVTMHLALEGYEVMTASDGERLVDLVRKENPTLVLVGGLLPTLDSSEVCQRIRGFSRVPIIMMAVKNRPDDIVRGLDAGADDYVIKPFNMEVLLARIMAVLKRANSQNGMPNPGFVSGGLSIDSANQIVMKDGKELLLTPTESKILYLLSGNAGKTVTRNHILKGVWGEGYYSDYHILQTTIARLRKKIGDTSRNPKHIATIRKIGYVFKKPE